MPLEIHAGELQSKLKTGKSVHLVDVRETWERAIAKLADHQHIPLGELPERVAELRAPEGALVVIYCHHGVRSLAAAAFLEQQGVNGVVSLAGGIDGWSTRVDPSIPVY